MFVELPSDVQRLVWGYVGNDILETPTGKIMKDFHYTIYSRFSISRRLPTRDELDEVAPVFVALSGENGGISYRNLIILKMFMSIQKEISNLRYPKLNVEEAMAFSIYKGITDIASCRVCLNELTKEEYRTYGKRYCEICYGYENGMLKDHDGSGMPCNECGMDLTVEEYRNNYHYGWRCLPCFEEELRDDETDEEDEDD